LQAKTIKALDALIAALEECADALKAEANKSGDTPDDEDTGSVPRRGRPAKSGAVSGKGKAARPAPDDDDDMDGDADDSADDGDDDLPPAKAPVKGKAPAKPAAKPAAKGKKVEAEADIDAVKEKLTAVMNEDSLGKDRVVRILKKFGAARSSDLDEGDYAAVIKACDVALAEVGDEEEDV
jgi:hypothetical protein